MPAILGRAGHSVEPENRLGRRHSADTRRHDVVTPPGGLDRRLDGVQRDVQLGVDLFQVAIGVQLAAEVDFPALLEAEGVLRARAVLAAAAAGDGGLGDRDGQIGQAHARYPLYGRLTVRRQATVGVDQLVVGTRPSGGRRID